MKTVAVDEAKVILDADGVVGKALYERPEYAVVHLELAPGATVAPHVTPFDALFHVLEGNGIVTLNGEELRARPGLEVEVPAGVSKSVRNDGPAPLKLLVVKCPNPA